MTLKPSLIHFLTLKLNLTWNQIFIQALINHVILDDLPDLSLNFTNFFLKNEDNNAYLKGCWDDSVRSYQKKRTKCLRKAAGSC